MKSVFDVPANKMIEATAQKLKEIKEIQPPEYMEFVKTGSHVEFAPEDKDFWYVRCASILRQAYVHGKVSVGGLKVHYGGRLRHVVRRAHHRDAGGSIIRKAMQQLEKAGLLEKREDGRVITGAGKKLMDSVAKEL